MIQSHKSMDNGVQLATVEFYRDQEQLQSRAGYKFFEDDPAWTIEKGMRINVGKTRQHLDIELRQGFQKTIAHYAANHSSSYTKILNECFYRMLRKCKSMKISVPMLISYWATLNRETEWHMGVVRPFLCKWHGLGYPGVSEDVVALLRGWTIRGCIKGDAIKRMHPIAGPLTDNELLGFNEATVRAYESELIGIDLLALAILCSHTGRRPRQIAHIKLMDLVGTQKNKKGEPMYIIHIPRAKQRQECFRDSFKDFALTQEIWVILDAQKKFAIETVEKKLGMQLESSDRAMLPLFPDLRAFDGVTNVQDLREMLPSDRLHLAPHRVTEKLKKIVSNAQCYSERTGEILDIVARRFRYTIGTRAAREGFGPMVIAELLDHSNIENISVYTKNIPENAAALDRAVGFQLAPLAQAFQGVLINREEDAKRGSDSSSRIRHKGEGMGTCGTRGYCGANVPIPCYTCMHFQPWIDGPHEAVYEDLLKDQERIQQITGDATIASVNERSILAVAKVIQLCNERKKEISKDKVNG